MIQHCQIHGEPCYVEGDMEDYWRQLKEWQIWGEGREGEARTGQVKAGMIPGQQSRRVDTGRHWETLTRWRGSRQGAFQSGSGPVSQLINLKKHQMLPECNIKTYLCITQRLGGTMTKHMDGKAMIHKLIIDSVLPTLPICCCNHQSRLIQDCLMYKVKNDPSVSSGNHP